MLATASRTILPFCAAAYNSRSAFVFQHRRVAGKAVSALAFRPIGSGAKNG
jgi:hypothetical protein